MQNLYRFACLTLWLLVVAMSARAQDLATRRQSGYYTFIYKVRPGEVQRLYDNIHDFDVSMLDTLVDVYPTDSTYAHTLPVGHYMFMYANGGDLGGELRSVNNVDLKVLNNRRDLVLVLYDSLGREITDAHVYVRQKKIPYDTVSDTYRLASANRQGVLRVEYQGHVSYFAIQRQSNNGLVARTGRKVLRSAPVKILLSPYHYVKRNISNLVYGSRLSPPGIYYRLSPLWGDVSMGGYVATNKPVYKAGDTVRLKAYIVSQHGRRFRKPVDLYLSDNSYRDDVSDRKLGTAKPFRPGAYTHELVLHDSLGLLRDRRYFIRLQRGRRRTLPPGSFQFQDYVLQQNTYSVRVEQGRPGEPSWLYLKGVDANDLPVYDGRAEILLRPVRVQQYFPRQVFVPDTLWYHTLVLDPVGETAVVLPDSVMPDVALRYEAVVSFLNSSQERIEKVVSLSYNRRPFPVALLLRGDTVQVKAWDAGKYPVSGAVRLETFTGVGTSSMREVVLPYQEKVRYTAALYRVHYADSAVSLAPRDEAAALVFTARRTHDSLYVKTENPRHILFRYFLFRNSRLIAMGKDVDLLWMRKADARATYTLSVQYTWGGNVYNEEHPFTFDTHELAIGVEHPDQVYPGQRAPITITVRDTHGRPVRDVDLTAYAYTRKFTMPTDVAVPNLGKMPRKRAERNVFLAEGLKQRLSRPLSYATWGTRLGLDSLLFYRFLFPASGYFENRQPSDVAQVAPFVVLRGELIPAHIVYVDGRVVYYGGALQQPYSFTVQPGEHTVTIRLPLSQITLPRVRIDSAQKLILSLDYNHLPAQATRVEMPYKLTKEEVVGLATHFIPFERAGIAKSTYLQQGDHYLTLNGREGNLWYSLVGPVYPGMAAITHNDSVRMTFPVELDYQYQLRNNMLLLKKVDVRSRIQQASRPWNMAFGLLRDRAYTAQRMRFVPGGRVKQFYHYRQSPRLSKSTQSMGRVTLDPYPAAKGLAVNTACFIRCDGPEEQYPFAGNVLDRALPVGTYRVVVVFETGQYVQVDSLVVRPYGHTYRTVDDSPLSAADAVSAAALAAARQRLGTGPLDAVEREQEVERLRNQYYIPSASRQPWGTAVQGRVTDEDGLPIPGVNVMVGGSTQGTISDMDGYYTLDCPPNATLVFSFIGYSTVERAADQSVVNVSLHADVQMLQEVVVAGYHRALQGRMAGLAVRGANSLDVEDKAKTRVPSRPAVSSQDIPENLRSNFRDDAFWQPRLRTDRAGRAVFEARFPDDITGWNIYVLGMGSRRRTGQTRAYVPAYKPLLAEVSLPQFLVAGDHAVALGKITQHNNEVMHVMRSIVVNDVVQRNDSVALDRAVIDSLYLHTVGHDSVSVRYTAATQQYRDGEVRTLPVYPRGTLETTGMFASLASDTTFTWRFGDTTAVTIHAQGNLSDVLLQEVAYLKSYPYDCNEQLASRLRALLVEQQLLTYQKKEFRAQAAVEKLIRKLVSHQNRDGAWSWWNSGATDVWVTLHVARSLQLAARQGYAVPVDKALLFRTLAGALSHYSLPVELAVMQFLLEQGQTVAAQDVVYAVRQSTRATLRERLLVESIVQLTGGKIDRAWIQSMRQVTSKGNYYWGVYNGPVDDNALTNTWQVYQLLAKEEGVAPQDLTRIRYYFLEMRGQHWRNTYESSLLLEMLSPALTNPSQRMDRDVTLRLSGDKKDTTIHAFPYTFRGNVTALQVSKTGDWPVYLTAHQQHRVENPAPVDKDFVVTTAFEPGSLRLVAGKPVRLTATVTVKHAADYVMLEIPIPAGCSYGARLPGANREEVYREHRYEKTVIFFKHLEPGVYRYTVELIPRFSGTYALNPARVECMYFPTLFGREGIKTVTVR
ncbi:carboxypeptidase-like regulatory domain-containing protein [Parachryseolinea silvisoli]|uniref:carboxypeptidase-like regulatory domain-containing protein n=1 Tax=Parachryseolinea silvisoli TaxID=2873601 RepID=UPI00226580F8|nr:carboxypeptidase-like regulatory domain-containing protein [Parachryseolinea silvisoli]MCD9018621.1 carboxypeptidase-like regulatory domain-containing protein [Parachryseolinea silvisoli]